MAGFILRSLLMLLAAFGVGLLGGWLFWRRAGRADPAPPSGVGGVLSRLDSPSAPLLAPAMPANVAKTTRDAAPAVPDGVPAPSPRPPEADDDLTGIEGVGKRSAEALRSAGLRRYADVAAADEETLRAAVRAAGIRPSPTLPIWPASAAALAAPEPQTAQATPDDAQPAETQPEQTQPGEAISEKATR